MSRTSTTPDDRRHGVDAVLFPAAIGARLAGKAAAEDAVLGLDVDEGIHVRARHAGRR